MKLIADMFALMMESRHYSLRPRVTQKNVPQNVPEKLNKTQLRVFELIRKDPSITILEMSSRLFLADKTIKRVFSYLKATKLIKRVSPDKGGHWEVIVEEKEKSHSFEVAH